MPESAESNPSRSKKAPRRSFIRHICPVTGRHTDVPLSEAPEGTFEIIDDPENPLPPNVGRVTIEFCVPNPELAEHRIAVAEVERERAKALQEYLRDVKQQINRSIGDLDAANLSNEEREEIERFREGLTAEQIQEMKRVRAALADGTLAMAARQQLAINYPMPDEPEGETAHFRCVISSLHMEALAAGIKGLRDAGFPVRDPNEEVAE